MRRARSTACLALPLAVVLTHCGGGSSSSWQDVRTVQVTVSQPGLPPPGGLPRTTIFTSAADVARATAALNAHHIVKQDNTSPSSPCAGGFHIDMAVSQAHASPTEMSGYVCAGRASGEIGGDVTGFLSAIGVRLGG